MNSKSKFVSKALLAGIAVACLAVASLTLVDTARAKDGSDVVILETSKGTIKVELYAEKAPISVKNFLWYVDNNFYDGLIFHRVMPNFMIQGGGFTKDMVKKDGKPPIKNEASNGLKNERGTLAMARTQVIDSATAQFFINLKDNGFLNQTNKTAQGFGYAVFGKVIEGMDVVDKIAAVKCVKKGRYDDVPATPITIDKAYRAKESAKEKKKD